MSRLSKALIAHYKMNDDAASATVIDETGSHDGTYKDTLGNENTSTGASAGKVNGSLAFDQANTEYVEIADHADFSPVGTPFSIIADINMTDATNFAIASKGIYNADGEWYFTLVDEILCAFLFDESVVDCFMGRKYSVALTGFQGKWIQVGFSYDGKASSSGVKIYLNGKRVDNTDNNSVPTFVEVENQTGNIWIGRCAANYSSGFIDNVRFFNVELTADEFRRFHNKGHSSEILAVGDESRRDLRRRERY